MSANYLIKRHIEILMSLRDRAGKDNKYLLDHAINGSLPRSDIEAVCQIINDEYLMHGIEKDYKPNDYGLELEKLLDAINRPRVS